MKNKILMAVLLVAAVSPLFAQSFDALPSAFEKALSGLKPASQAQAQSLQGVPVNAPSAVKNRKERYYYFASIQIQSREVVSRQDDKAVLKFKGVLVVRNFNSGLILADPAAVELLEEVTVSPNGSVNHNIRPKIYNIPLFIKERRIATADFDKGGFMVKGKISDKKVRVAGSGRIWGWVEFL